MKIVYFAYVVFFGMVLALDTIPSEEPEVAVLNPPVMAEAELCSSM